MIKPLVATLSLAFTLVGVPAVLASEVPSHSLDGPSQVDRPNILLIVADDLGYSDLGSFGGEIDTPNLDALAEGGIRLTNFYTAPTCSPTRSMLLTGQDSHRVGMGAMSEALGTFKILQGQPGYEGYLNPASTTIAEALGRAGYRTFMSGKWHLGSGPEQQPSAHGFDRSFVLLQGGADHFGAGQNGGPALQPATYTEDGQPAEFPIGAYSSDLYAERLIDYLGNGSSEKPFFAYLAFTAPHWPLQAPKDLIAKYEGRYAAGPAALRRERLKKMQTLGILSESIDDESLISLSDWAAKPKAQRLIHARNMASYAAMVDSLDQNVGRVLEHLRATGEYDNTVILFMSDNGAEGIALKPLIKRTSNSTPPVHKAQVLATVTAANDDLSKMGTTESFITYGREWATAAMVPFRNIKGDAEEGGVRAPAFITGKGIKGQRLIDNPLSVRDVMPTLLDIAHVTHSEHAESQAVSVSGISLPTGKSWWPILDGSADQVRSDTDSLAWELHLKRGVRVGHWKAVFGRDGGGPPGAKDAKPPSWKLYDLSSDIGENNDLSQLNPDVLARLVAVWTAYAEQNGVFVPGPPKK